MFHELDSIIGPYRISDVITQVPAQMVVSDYLSMDLPEPNIREIMIFGNSILMFAAAVPLQSRKSR